MTTPAATAPPPRTTAAVVIPPTRDPLTRLTESLEQEHSFLRVPLNHFINILGSNYRFALYEINAVISAVNSAAHGDLSLDDAVKLLSSLLSTLGVLKQQLGERSLNEDLQAERFTSRLNHIDLASLPSFPHWKTLRMNRILVDYLLRMSYRETAIKLAEITDIQKFIDLEEFDEAREVISALQNKDVALALAWCADNKSELEESESKLEINLRLQEFLEFVRAENDTQAITYAKKYLAPWITTDMKDDVKRVLATLVFGSNTEYARYKVLFEAKQWDYLVDRFKQEFYKLYGMTFDPLLLIYLQAGLCALKNPICYNDDRREKPGPLSHNSFRNLASPLPFPLIYHQKLVCYITGEVMCPGNHPIILPNGYLYSYKACQYMIHHNNRNITCPRTGAVCRPEDCLRFHTRDG